jgi:hypothetical protein
LTPPRRRGNGSRVLLRLAIGVAVLAVLLFVGYLLGARWALSGKWVRSQINLKPDELFMDWDEASSIWPGRVTIRNLRIRGSDPNVQWIVTVPSGTIRYSVMALLTRTFRATAFRPSSIQFRLRQKVKPEDAKSPRLRFLPEIPGFSDPPLRTGRGLPKPPPNPWTIHLLDVTTDALDDIWVDGIRYRGPATLDGGFRLRPGIRARIGPATVDFRGGKVELDETPAVTELKGRLEAKFDDWDVQELIENKVFRVVTASVELEGPTPGVEALPLDLGKGVKLSGGPGKLSISGKIDRGTAEGSVELTAKGGRYTRPDLKLEGSADAVLKFSEWVLDGGEPQIGGSTLKVTDVYVAGSKGRTKGWWGNFRVSSGRLGKELIGKVTLKCRDARPFLAFLGESLPKWTGDLLELEGLTVTADVVLSEPRTTVRNLKVKGGKYTILGEYDRRGERSRGAFYVEGGLLNVGVELVDGKPKIQLLGPRKWFDKQRGLTATAR